MHDHIFCWFQARAENDYSGALPAVDVPHNTNHPSVLDNWGIDTAALVSLA